MSPEDLFSGLLTMGADRRDPRGAGLALQQARGLAQDDADREAVVTARRNLVMEWLRRRDRSEALREAKTLLREAPGSPAARELRPLIRALERLPRTGG